MSNLRRISCSACIAAVGMNGIANATWWFEVLLFASTFFLAGHILRHGTDG